MKANKRLLYKPPPLDDYSKNFCKLWIVIGISIVFIAGEFIGGYISHSISVISDAFHLVTDLIGFSVSFIFISFSRKDPTEKMSFGYHRMELIGALGNLFIIWILAIFMIYEATLRVIDKEFVEEPLAMLIVGVAGLAVNIIMYFVLHSGSHSHGLMADSCDHHHQPHDNDPNPSNCTTSFCNELLCQDQDCLKQINYSHCHIKNPKGTDQIHIHDKDRKLSAEIQNGEQGQNSMNQMGNMEINIKKQEMQMRKHNHDHDHQHGHSHEKHEGHSHEHKPGQKCTHHHSQSPQKGKKYKEKSFQSKSKHQHTDKCSHNHDKKHDHKHQKQHKHGHDHKQNGHKHDHEHQHGHDHGHQHESLSMKAAVLHALSDVIQSIGLLISSLFIFFLGSDKGAKVTEWNDWHYFDPIATYIFSVLVIISTIPIVKNCYFLIMESTPSTETARQIKRQFEETPGVIDVHDLHIWSLRPGKNLLMAHVFAKQGTQRQVLTGLTEICRKRRIFHSTLQVQQQNWKNHDQYILCDHDIH